MNLKPRFLLLTVLLFVVTAIPLWFAVRTLADHVAGDQHLGDALCLVLVHSRGNE